ncbi:MAG: S-methyl-5'-thioadenosine phosphorylase [Nitrospira sp.]|nr:S-methyl-5'-thioadenosine phosphorylase [Nitrospira sp.]
MPPKPRADIGVVGGSGLYDMEGLERVREVRVATPFGQPSDAVVLGTIAERRVAFLARHGRGHRINPSMINYRANIYALKSLGVTRIFSVSAVGSMKETVQPGHLVFPNSFIDRTTKRVNTFFDEGLVAHVAFADPVCPVLTAQLAGAARSLGATFHAGGTYLCIEGPQFSTRAESSLYRQWGVDLIGMTNATEARLAREAEICYATMALVTDYDCWHESEESVSVEAVLTIMHQNVAQARRLLKHVIRQSTESGTCACATALRSAILTAPEAMTASVKRRYKLFLEPSPASTTHGGT